MKRSPLSRISPRRKKEQAEWHKQRDVYLKLYDMCEAVIMPRCDVRATEVHHMRGRGKYLLDQSTWLPVCFACHAWIHANPAQARKFGLMQDRLKTT